MKRDTGIIFKIFLAAETRRGKQEGWIKLWKRKGKLVGHKPEPFDFLDEIPGRIRRLLKACVIQWPPEKSN